MLVREFAMVNITKPVLGTMLILCEDLQWGMVCFSTSLGVLLSRKHTTLPESAVLPTGQRLNSKADLVKK